VSSGCVGWSPGAHIPAGVPTPSGLSVPSTYHNMAII